MRHKFCHIHQLLAIPSYEKYDKLMRIKTTKHNGDSSPYGAKKMVPDVIHEICIEKIPSQLRANFSHIQ
jgi:hypothetical protein